MLVPLEVWNVWYAMDEGEEEGEERPPEETPKMHLLLQYVPAEAATQETAQLREMRAQDFLLRALQQLNSSLEAKVLVHQVQGGALADVSLGSLASSAVARSAPGGGGGGEALLRPGGALADVPLGSVASSAVAWSAPGGGEALLRPEPPSARSQTSVSVASAPQAGALGDGMLLQQGAAAPQQRRRSRPDGEELHVAQVTEADEEHERKAHDLYARLVETSRRCAVEVEAERKIARQAQASMGSLEQRVVEIQQEVALRKAHEDSLQRRIALLESELSVAHQKCVLFDSIEDEAQDAHRELEGLRTAKRELEERFEEQRSEATKLREESRQLKMG